MGTYATSVTTFNSNEKVHMCSLYQRRNKQIFFLWEHKILELGFLKSTWNFLEASHGKWAADGIGAAVKRNADNAVIIRKKNINNAKDFIEANGQSSKVKFFLVSEEDIRAVETDLPAILQPIPGTMKIHQLILEKPGSISSRVLSCFCGHPATLLCDCFQPTMNTVAPKKQLHQPPAEPLEHLRALPLEHPEHLSEQPLVQNTSSDSPLQDNTRLFVDESLIGKYVVVTYDSLPYPGIVMDVDEDEIEVKVMHRVGVNRYFWPRTDDILWYTANQVLTVLESDPQPVTARHCQIEPKAWKLIEKQLEL